MELNQNKPLNEEQNFQYLSIPKLLESGKLSKESTIHLSSVYELVRNISEIAEKHKENLAKIQMEFITVSKIKSSKKLNFYIRTMFINRENEHAVDVTFHKSLAEILKTIEKCDNFDITQAGKILDSNSRNPALIDLKNCKSQLFEAFLGKQLLTEIMKESLESSLETTTTTKRKNKI